MKNLFLLLFCFLLLSCKPVLETGNDIINFKFQEIAQTYEATISNDTVNIVVPTTAYLTALTPIFEVSPNATINPASGVKQDFSKPFLYTVTSETGTSKTFTVLAYTQPTFRVNNIQLPDNFVTGLINADNISFTVPFGTNVSALKINYTLAETGILSNIVSGGTVDLKQPLELIDNVYSISILFIRFRSKLITKSKYLTLSM